MCVIVSVGEEEKESHFSSSQENRNGGKNLNDA